MQNKCNVIQWRGRMNQHLRHRPCDHSEDFAVARIGNCLHVADDAYYGEPGAIAVDPSPANSFSDRRFVRPKSARYTLADDTDKRRIGSVTFKKITPLQERLSKGL